MNHDSPQPDADALYDRGHAAATAGRIDEAIECFRRVLALRPRDADACSNLGALLQHRGELDAAAAAFERALAIAPGHAEALNNLATVLEDRGRNAEAIALYRRALEAEPRAARIAYNLGLAHLRALEFEPGWRYCEARFHTSPPVTPLRPFPFAPFAESDFGRGRRIAIWCEQGVGDQVLYSTLLPELAACGERFVVELDPRLLPAYRRSHPAWDVVAPDQSFAAFAPCERHIALGSLPRLLRSSREAFARQPRALLGADPERARHYRAKLETESVRLIGISWRSALKPKMSARLDLFRSLSTEPGARLLDLQYGDTAAERAAFANAGGVLAHLDDLDLFHDLEGALAAIEACDLIVTTSNVTAHFAGALGKPTWLLSPGHRPLYYWVPDADGRSLWYPSVRIANADTWEGTIAVVQAALRRSIIEP